MSRLLIAINAAAATATRNLVAVIHNLNDIAAMRTTQSFADIAGRKLSCLFAFRFLERFNERFCGHESTRQFRLQFRICRNDFVTTDQVTQSTGMNKLVHELFDPAVAFR